MAAVPISLFVKLNLRKIYWVDYDVLLWFVLCVSTEIAGLLLYISLVHFSIRQVIGWACSLFDRRLDSRTAVHLNYTLMKWNEKS